MHGINPEQRAKISKIVKGKENGKDECYDFPNSHCNSYHNKGKTCTDCKVDRIIEIIEKEG